MNDDRDVWILIGTLLLAMSASWAYIGYLRYKLKKALFESQNSLKDVARSKEQLVDHIKSKIDATRTIRHHNIKVSDLMSDYLYSQDCVREIAQDLDKIYHSDYAALRKKYNQLTDLDLLIMSLLANGMENHEICTLLHMERLTLYKRRQIISKRIDISSTELEQFCSNVLLGE